MSNSLNTAQPTRPLLRYFGGKWNLAPWIVSQFPEHTRYVEPYGGGGSILLSKPACHGEIYNDLDQEIVNLFSVVRNDRDALIEQINLTPFARSEFELSYKTNDNPVEQARRTLVRSWMGFASQAACGARSGFRNSATREYTLPVHDWASIAPSVNRISKRLQSVIIENRDALQVMRQYDGPEALFYVDPPYVPETRSAEYQDVYRHEMTAEQHIDMLACLKSLKGMVILSGYHSQLYSDALTGWDVVTNAAKAGGRSTGDLSREEVLWFNPACAQALARQNIQSGFNFDDTEDAASLTCV